MHYEDFYKSVNHSILYIVHCALVVYYGILCSILQYIMQYTTVHIMQYTVYAVYYSTSCSILCSICGMYSLHRVIVEGECVQDWNSKMVEIKQSFVQLPDLLHSTRGKGQQPAVLALYPGLVTPAKCWSQKVWV